MELAFQIMNAEEGDMAHFACGGMAVIEHTNMYEDTGEGACYYFSFHDGVRVGYRKNGKMVSYPARILDIVAITKKGEGVKPPDIAAILAAKDREIADLKDRVRGISNELSVLAQGAKP
jgi:hypothetical protein